MTQAAADIEFRTSAGGRATGGTVRRAISHVRTALRRSEEKRRLAATLASREVGRQTGARC